MPVTIVGTPLSRSRTKRTGWATRSGANSEVKIATRRPTGIAIRAARPTMIPVPTIALEMPPLVSPKRPAGVVRKWMLRAPIPFETTEPTTISSTATASSAATVEMTSTTRLTRLRRFRLPRSSSSAWLLTESPCVRGPIGTDSSTRRSPCRLGRSQGLDLGRRDVGVLQLAALHDQPRDQVDDHREGQQDQAEVGQRRLLQRSRRALELGGDLGRHRAAGVEEGGVDPGGAADHLGDRDRLADRPAEAEDGGADDAGARVGQHDLADHLPAGRA